MVFGKQDSWASELPTMAIKIRKYHFLVEEPVEQVMLTQLKSKADEVSFGFSFNLS